MLFAATKSSEDTQAFAAALTECVTDRDIVMLIGDMGAGKTTFTQGFGAALGIDEPITSPTFILMRSYEGRLKLHHVDIYRLEHLQEVIDLGLMEQLEEGGVALVEWGNLAAPVMPRDFLEVRLRVDEVDDDRRVIRLKPVGPSWSAREAAMSKILNQWLVEEEA